MRTPSGVTTKAWSGRLLVPGSTGTPGGLPLGDLLLDIVDDEADVIDDRTHAALALLLAEVEVDVDAREHHQGIATDVEHLGAHGEEELLVGIDVIGGDVPVPHGYAGRVERRRLRGRAARDKRRRKQ